MIETLVNQREILRIATAIVTAIFDYPAFDVSLLFFEDRSLFDPGPLIGYCIVATRRTFQLFQSHKLTPIFSRRIYFFHPICAYYFHPATWSRQFLSKQFCQKKHVLYLTSLFGDSASQVCKASSSKSMPFLSGSSELRGVYIVHSFTSAGKNTFLF